MLPASGKQTSKEVLICRKNHPGNRGGGYSSAGHRQFSRSSCRKHVLAGNSRLHCSPKHNCFFLAAFFFDISSAVVCGKQEKESNTHISRSLTHTQPRARGWFTQKSRQDRRVDSNTTASRNGTNACRKNTTSPRSPAMPDYSDLDRQIEQLKRCEIIKENEVKALCAKAREILVEEGNVQRVDSPVTVSSIQ